MSNMSLTKRMVRALAITMTFVLLAAPAAADDDELSFGAAVVIIELTDNDIELQVFVDGFLWKSLQVFNPLERKVFNLNAKRNLRRQGGLSELFFASQPTHYLEDEPEFDGTIEEFLARFPAGEYEFEGTSIDGQEIDGVATLTHMLPALPEIISPVSATDEPPLVNRRNLVIKWEPVTTRFIGEGSVDIIEYQIILDQVEPLREMPWVDGGTRRALINLPGNVTRLKVPPQFLKPNSLYEFEVLAIEKSGNSTISVGEFRTR